MTLTQMQYFSAVCQYQNISVAAKTLYITQPALSSSLADLEREVGFKLLERKSKGVVPTEEGLRLLEHIQAVLNRYQLMENDIPFIPLNQNTLRVGFRPFGGENTFFRIYKDFAAVHKDTILRVEEISNQKPVIFLEEDQIDFLITTSGNISMNRADLYEYHLLGPEDVTLYAHRDSLLCMKDVLSLMDLSGYPMVFWEGHRHFMEHFSKLMTDEGGQLNVVSTVSQVAGVLQFICNNLAIGFLSGDYLNEIHTIKKLPLPVTAEGESCLRSEVDIYAIWKKSVERIPLKRQFADYLRSI